MDDAGSPILAATMSGAEIVVQALKDQGVAHIFGPAHRGGEDG